MDKIQVRTAVIAYLGGALKFAEEIKNSTTAYLIERALALDRTDGDQHRLGWRLISISLKVRRRRVQVELQLDLDFGIIR
jgi:hypothetical protein